MAVNNATFTVEGIESESDASEIEAELEEVDGVMDAEVDHGSGETEVSFDVDILSEERVKITVREMGYTVE